MDTNSLKGLLDTDQGKLSGSHFDLSRRIHVTTYYHAKKIFQNSRYSKALAEHMQKQISGAISNLNDTTFIGYGNYIGLFLTELCDGLSQKTDTDVNYALVEENDEGYSFLFYPELKQNLVIILPITCTFGAVVETRNFIESFIIKEKINPKTFCSKAFTVFLVADEAIILENDGIVDVPVDKLHPELKELYESYYWHAINKERVKFRFKSKNISLQYSTSIDEGYYLFTKSSHLFLAEKCPLCFPHIKTTRLIPGVGEKEVPLIQTHFNHDSPNNIQNLPRFDERTFTNASKDFSAVMKLPSHEPYVQLSAYLRIGDNIFLNYIQRDIFYSHNGRNILDFFESEILKILSQGKVLANKIIFVVPGHMRASTFLEDISKRLLCKNENLTITLIRCKPSDEFMENFIETYKGVIKSADKIFYFDDIIAGVKTFKFISDCVKNARKEGGKTSQEKGFDAILTLVDRTTELVKTELRRNITAEPELNADNSFISYFKLNVPALDPTRIGNPVEKRIALLRKMYDDCHIDALKMFIGTEIKRRLPQKLQILERDYGQLQLPYFPFIKRLPTFYLYKGRFTYQLRDLIKLEISHDIGTWLLTKDDFGESELSQLITVFTADEKLRTYFGIPLECDLDRDRDCERSIITNYIIKALCRPPFTFYKKIYETLFAYVDEKFRNICSTLDIKMGLHGTIALSFEELQNLKFFIRRSVELNSNFIISKEFLLLLKKYLLPEATILRIIAYNDDKISETEKEFRIAWDKNKKHKLTEVMHIKYFIQSCYKELLSKNPVRSIVLEQLLNDDELLPEGMKEQDKTPLDKVISNSFYHLGRIIKAENVFLIGQLKDKYIQDQYETTRMLEIKALIEGNKRNSIRRIRKLVKSHYTFEDAGLLNIKNIIWDLEKGEEEKMQCLKKVFQLRNLQDTPGTGIVKKYLEGERDEFDVLPRFKSLLGASNFSAGQKVAENIEESVDSMLETVSQLKRPGGKPDNGNGTAGKIFDSELRKILDSSCSIMGKNLEYGFFIEYRDIVNEESEFADNIFEITSSRNIKHEDNDEIKISKSGMIYNMLRGLKDFENGNIQTFTAFARKDKKLLSFNHQYYVDELFVRSDCQKNNGLSTTLPVKNNILTANQAIYEDCNSGGNSVPLIKDSTMLLFVRFSKIELDAKPNKYSDQGRALLVIGSKEEVDTQSFIRFVNTEKVRLLLLIKEEVLDYLQKQFDNDAFFEVLESREFRKYQREVRHGISGYLDAQMQYFDRIRQGENVEKYRVMSDIVNNAILWQLQPQEDNNKRIEMPFTVSQIYETIKAILEDDCLGDQDINLDEVDINGFEIDRIIEIYPALYYVILPELIINMKKYSPLKGEKELKIRMVENTIIFANKPYKEVAKKNYGGIVMCNRILEELEMDKLEFGDDQDKKFVVKLKLKN